MDEPQSTPQAVPTFGAFIYDRVVIHWKTTLLGITSAVLVVVPVLAATGFQNRWVALTGAVAMAITGALSKH